ncbi:MAG: hypothetical protein LBQ59_05845 [Candidatus Peribacteria bacterium]|jgi:hypothetical protein|nr:hypothetical protein [Candidatus Peribacteria bacterium]
MELIKIRNNPNLNLNETIEELRKSNFEEMETYDLIEKQNLLIRLLAKLENEEI